MCVCVCVCVCVCETKSPKNQRSESHIRIIPRKGLRPHEHLSLVRFYLSLVLYFFFFSPHLSQTGFLTQCCGETLPVSRCGSICLEAVERHVTLLVSLKSRCFGLFTNGSKHHFYNFPFSCAVTSNSLQLLACVP